MSTKNNQSVSKDAGMYYTVIHKTVRQDPDFLCFNLSTIYRSVV